MKDYDTPAELDGLAGVTRTFTLRGVQFVAKPAIDVKSWSVLYAIETGQAVPDVFDALNGVIRSNLVPSSRDAWDELISAEHEIPITFKTFWAIAQDLATEVTGRPPAPAQHSGPTAAANGTQSTVGSSPQPVGP